MHVTYLPRAVAAGARIRAGSRGPRADLRRPARSRGPVSGGYRRARRGDEAVQVRARKAVVLAGGAFGTPELLLRSGFRSPGGRARPQPANPSGVLGRGPLRGRGARLGGRHAELRRRRVGGPGHPARGDVHAARLRRPVAARAPAPSISDACSSSATSPRPASTSPTSPPGGSAWAPTARCGSATSSPARTPTGSCSGSPARRSSSTPPGRREVYPQISGIPTLPRGRIAELEASPPRRRAMRLEAFHPMGTARMDADPRRGVTAHGRGRPRRRGALRRRRQPAAELDRGQPDDDDHRDGLTGGAPGRRPAGLSRMLRDT